MKILKMLDSIGLSQKAKKKKGYHHKTTKAKWK